MAVALRASEGNRVPPLLRTGEGLNKWSPGWRGRCKEPEMEHGRC